MEREDVVKFNCCGHNPAMSEIASGGAIVTGKGGKSIGCMKDCSSL